MQRELGNWKEEQYGINRLKVYRQSSYEVVELNNRIRILNLKKEVTEHIQIRWSNSVKRLDLLFPLFAPATINYDFSIFKVIGLI